MVGTWKTDAGGPDLRYGDLNIWGTRDGSELVYLQILDGPIMCIGLHTLRELLGRFQREWPAQRLAHIEPRRAALALILDGKSIEPKHTAQVRYPWKEGT